jgi:hypothetical protein
MNKLFSGDQPRIYVATVHVLDMVSLSIISSIIHLVMDTENVSETRAVAPN